MNRPKFIAIPGGFLNLSTVIFARVVGKRIDLQMVGGIELNFTGDVAAEILKQIEAHRIDN